MNSRLTMLAALTASAVFCCPAADGQQSGVVVVSPAVDRAYLVTEPQLLDKVVDFENVFSGQDHVYGVSVTPAGICDAVVGGDNKLDLICDGAAFGTVEVRIWAQDSTGRLAIDTFKVTLRPVQMFVDANTLAAPQNQDGATWASAYQYLQDGLTQAVEGQEIWVADGVYYPDVDAGGDSGLRSSCFHMVKKIPMYGGFAGGEMTREERDLHLYYSILSGDIDQDDLQRPIASHVYPQTGDENNSYRVVDMSACGDDDVLDGFVITAGRADLASTPRDGAGLFTVKDVRIENCWITGNYAANGGGGLYIFDDNPMIVKCRVNGNAAGNAGGGVYARKGGARFYNSEMRGNEAQLGGALYLEDPNLELANCLITGNCGLASGGGIYIEDGKLAASNCTLSANFTDGTGGALKLVTAGGNPKIRNCIIWGNEAEGSTVGAAASVHVDDLGKAPKYRNSLVANSGGSAAWNGSAGIDEEGNLDLDPCFVRPISTSRQPKHYGFYLLKADSPALDAGLMAYLLKDKADLDLDDNTKELISFDLNGNARLVGAEVDLGVYEFDLAIQASLTFLLDSDGDGLSDDFELLHTGDPVMMEAMSDQDGDCLTALGEYVHGQNPTVGGEGPISCIGTVEYLGETYLTLTFRIDPQALNFATYTVQRRGGDDVPTVPWEAGQTVEISSVPSPANPELLEVTHRSLFPIGAEITEFLRVRHAAAL